MVRVVGSRILLGRPVAVVRLVQPKVQDSLASLPRRVPEDGSSRDNVGAIDWPEARVGRYQGNLKGLCQLDVDRIG